MTMKRLGLFAAALLAGCCGVNIGTEERRPAAVEEGFVSLFNGKDLSGWTGAKEVFSVELEKTRLNNGTWLITPVLASRPEIAYTGSGRANLCTEKSYRNFILRFEVQLPKNGDSGLGLRMSDVTQDAAYAAMGEIQLLDDGGDLYYDTTNKTDRLESWRYAGSLFGVAPALKDNVDKQIWGKDANFSGGGSYVRNAGVWNFVEVRVAGDEVEVWMNGICVTRANVAGFKGDGDTLDRQPHPGLHNARGHIGLLGNNHRVLFKNIRIRELPDDLKSVREAALPSDEAPDGFTTLFGGKAEDLLANWKGVTTEDGFDNPAIRREAAAVKRKIMQKIADLGMRNHWSVQDGALYFDGFAGGYSLATKRDYADFELWADWRLLSVTGDSGLYLRGAPQVQIWDAHNQWGIGSGGLFNNQIGAHDALRIADRPIGDWNRFHVIMRGQRVTVYLNGVLVTDDVMLENYWDRSKPIFPKEQLELQCHGDPIEWRNIFIRDL